MAPLLARDVSDVEVALDSLKSIGIKQCSVERGEPVLENLTNGVHSNVRPMHADRAESIRV